MSTAQARSGALAALAVLRSRPGDPEARRAYTAALITYGGTLRAELTPAAEQLWAQHGVDDAAVAAAWEGSDRSTAQGKFDAVSAVVGANKVRRELFSRAARDALAAQRPLGGAINLSEHTKLTKADTALLASTLDHLPSDILAVSDKVGVAVTVRRMRVRPGEVPGRAHFSSGEVRKRKQTVSAVFDARKALAGDDYWMYDRQYVPDVRDAANDTADWSPHAPLVDDTPENWAALERAAADYAASKRGAVAAEKLPQVRRVELLTLGADGDPVRLNRLALVTPNHKSRMVADSVTAVVTFTDHASLAHELGHRMEFNNTDVSAPCKTFLAQRTEGQPKELYSGSGKDAEYVKADGFVNRYMGKDYEKSHHTELFSTGVEAIFAGRHGGLLGNDINVGDLAEHGPRRGTITDQEHFDLVMGILATANTPVESAE